jgi:hypothetical protein
MNMFTVIDLILGAINKRFDDMSVQLTQLSQQVTTMDAATQAALDALSAEVARETTIEASVKTLLEGLAAQIEALKNTQTDPAVIAAIQAAADLVKANNDKFAADVTANTPT